MKIALCFYGQPRYIDNPLSYQTHKDHIYSQGTVDVYTHYWFNSSLTTYKTSDWSQKYENYVHSETPKIITELYNPKKYLEEKPKEDFDYNNFEQNVTHFSYYSSNNMKNLQSHLYSFEKCLNLVKESNTDYDFVIMSRFDNKIVTMPDLKTQPKEKVLLNNFVGNGCFPDVIVAFDYKLIDYFKPYTQFLEVTKHVSLFTAEEYKKHSFLLHRTINDFHYTNLYATVLRSKNDCIGQ